LILAAVALASSQRRLLTNNLDESLAAQSETLADAVAAEAIVDPLTVLGDDDAVAQIVDRSGLVIASTANVAGRPALSPPSDDRDEKYRTVKVLDGEPDYRLFSRRVGTVLIHTGAPVDDIDESVAVLRVGLVVAIPMVVIALAALIWWLVGRTLRPVEAIRCEVADISGRSLHRRVSQPRTDDEIARLARTMNAMLDRIEEASDRQQRFVADASHELRSPLTRIRTELEVDVGHPEAADLAATHRSVLHETEHLQRLVEDLLVLARHDANHDENRRTVLVDLDDIVMPETRRLREAAMVAVDTSGVSAAQVAGDPNELTRAMRNLLDNATRHAVSTVTVTLAERGDSAVLTVADDGPGIAPPLRERIFERFVRVDEARTSGDGGTGLGLAITREIVNRNGGTIRIDADYAPGARFIVELPLATRQRADPAPSARG
jgi:signal transduction histidine kinase